jgi:hypothetical protein
MKMVLMNYSKNNNKKKKKKANDEFLMERIDISETAQNLTWENYNNEINFYMQTIICRHLIATHYYRHSMRF